MTTNSTAAVDDDNNNNNDDNEGCYRIRETKSRYESLQEQITYQRKQGNYKIANQLVEELQKLRNERISLLEYEIERVANDKRLGLGLGGPNSELCNALIDDLEKLVEETGDKIIVGGFIDLSNPRSKIPWIEMKGDEGEENEDEDK
jgi:hypothetical protein